VTETDPAEEGAVPGSGSGGNDGIIAGGHANVSGNAVASGRNARANVQNVGSAPEQRPEPATPEQIRELLARLVEELGRSGRPDRTDLIEAAEDAREELAAPAPRTGKLKVLVAGLGRAVAGATSLATLTAAIEKAVHGL
jgi:hypothetical protein